MMMMMPIMSHDIMEDWLTCFIFSLQVLRGQYGLSLAFLLTPISVLQAEAAATGTLGLPASRILNAAYSALTAASGYLTLSGRGDQISKEDILSLESVDRWSTNTQAAGSLAAILALFYLSQAFLAADPNAKET